MTIQTVALRKAGPFAGNAVAVSFPFTFKVFAATDVSVTETLVATGVDTLLVLSSGYAVTLNADQENNPGGAVIYQVGGVTTPLPTSKKLTMLGATPATQPVDLTNRGGFFPEVIETVFDRLTILIQQLLEKFSRTISFSPSDSAQGYTLPPAAVRANRYLAFDALGNPTTTTLVVPTYASLIATLGYTPVNRAGDTVTGPFRVASAIPIADNSTLVATTAFVRAQGFLTVAEGGAAVFTQPEASAVARTVVDRMRDDVYVTDYMTAAQVTALRAGTATDVTAAWQAALAARPGKPLRLIAPGGGDQLITTTLTCGNRPIRIVGDHKQSCRLIFTTSNAGLHFRSDTVPAQLPSPVTQIPSFALSGITIQCNAPASGDGLLVSYASHGGEEAPCEIRDIQVQNGIGAYWQNAIRTQNVSNGTIEKADIFCYGGPPTAKMLFIDNTGESINYGMWVRNCYMNGAPFGIYQIGGLETLYLQDNLIVAGTPIHCDGQVTQYKGADLKISGGHYNAQANTIEIGFWKSVYITGVDIYSGVNVGDVTGANLVITSCDRVMISNCKMHPGASSTTVLRSGIAITNTLNVSISNCQIYCNANGIIYTGPDSGVFTVSGTTVNSDGGTPGTGIYVVDGGGNTSITGGSVVGFVNGASSGISINTGGARISGVLIQNNATGVFSNGSANIDARSNNMIGNGVNFSGAMRRDFRVQQPLAPAVVANGVISAVGLTLPGSQFGDSIAIGGPGALGNMTYTAFVNGPGGGVMLIDNKSGSPITPPAGLWTFVVSN